jgi:hypothetical protein
MARGRAEAAFEYRVQRRLERAGCVVINAARSRPVDLIVFPSRLNLGPTSPTFVEVKARNTDAPREQEEMQRRLARAAGCNFLRLRQGRIRGRVTVEAHEMHPPDDEGDLAALMNAAFGRGMWDVRQPRDPSKPSSTS